MGVGLALDLINRGNLNYVQYFHLWLFMYLFFDSPVEFTFLNKFPFIIVLVPFGAGSSA